MELQNILAVDLIKEFGIDQLPQEEQDSVLKSVGDTFNQRMMMRIIEALPEEDQEEMLQMIKASGDDWENVELFLKERIPNLNDLVQEELASYKQEMMNFMEEIKK